MKLTLEKPIVVGEQTITELIFREEVVAGDLRGTTIRETMSYDDLLKIAGRLCGQTDQVMNRLSVARGDLARVMDAVGSFITGDPGPKTGQIGSA